MKQPTVFSGIVHPLWTGVEGSFPTSLMSFTNYVAMAYTDTSDEAFSAPNINNAAATGTLTITYWMKKSERLLLFYRWAG